MDGLRFSLSHNIIYLSFVQHRICGAVFLYVISEVLAMAETRDIQLAESLPAGLITMLLTGYLERIRRLEVLLGVTLVFWLVSVIAFVIYICR